MFQKRLVSLAFAAGLAVSLAGCYQPVGPYGGYAAPVYGGVVAPVPA